MNLKFCGFDVGDVVTTTNNDIGVIRLSQVDTYYGGRTVKITRPMIYSWATKSFNSLAVPVWLIARHDSPESAALTALESLGRDDLAHARAKELWMNSPYP